MIEHAADTHLFLDRRLLERTEGVAVRLAPCVRHPENPLPLDGERVWGFGNLTASIYWDDAAQTYRGWFPRHVVRGEEASTFEPVTSEDGIHWRSAGPAYGEAGARTIIYDARESDPRRRYKAVQQAFARPEPDGGETPVPTAEGRRMHMAREPLLRRMMALTSPDGRTWSAPHPIVRSLPEPSHAWWMPGEPGWEGGDNFPCILWAPDLGRYVTFFRTNIYNGQGQHRERAVGRADSADFERWGEHSLALQSRVLWHSALGYERHDFYQMQVWRCGGIYLGIVSVFYWDQDRVHLELAWSPDTLNWERVCPGQDVVPHGALGEFDGGCRYAAMAPIARSPEQGGPPVGDDVRVYYGGSDGRHNADRTGNSALCLATFRRDRFAGLATTGGREGVVLTRPLTLAGGHIAVNADAAGGAIRAALCDEGGTTLPGFSEQDAVLLTGNSLDRRLSWSGGDLATFRGHTVRLRLHLRNAAVYALALA